MRSLPSSNIPISREDLDRSPMFRFNDVSDVERVVQR